MYFTKHRLVFATPCDLFTAYTDRPKNTERRSINEIAITLRYNKIDKQKHGNSCPLGQPGAE